MLLAASLSLCAVSFPFAIRLILYTVNTFKVNRKHILTSCCGLHHQQWMPLTAMAYHAPKFLMDKMLIGCNWVQYSKKSCDLDGRQIKCFLFSKQNSFLAIILVNIGKGNKARFNSNIQQQNQKQCCLSGIVNHHGNHIQGLSLKIKDLYRMPQSL